MSRLSLTRAAIVQALASVPGIGRVHDRERYAKSETDFRRLYVAPQPDGTEQLRGWWIRRSETAEHAVSTARSAEVVTWTIRGFLAFSDESATELELDDLVEQFRDLVRADPTFGGVCEQGQLQGDGDDTDCVQVLDAGPVTFCGVLCHAVTLSLRTWSYL